MSQKYSNTARRSGTSAYRGDVQEVYPPTLASASSMESKPQESLSTNKELVKYCNAPLDRVEVKPAALLLTRAPMECLNDEFKPIAGLGPHFHAINEGISWNLRTDGHIVNLKAALKEFCLPMWPACREMFSAFTLAQYFYIHSLDELGGNGVNAVPITQARVARLLEPAFQTDVLQRAREAASQAAMASKAIREQALPRLLPLEKALDAYVADYVARAAEIAKRNKSRIPLALQDALWGPIEPTPLTTSEVQSFPARLSIVSHLLHQLPAFLDNLELHFRRLGEVDSQQLLEHGYSTADDFIRLFQDRTLCQYIVQDMRLRWIPPSRTFVLDDIDY